MPVLLPRYPGAFTHILRVFTPTMACGSTRYEFPVQYVDHRGYCGNADDLEAFRLTKSSMKSDIQKCLISCALSGMFLHPSVNLMSATPSHQFLTLVAII